MFRERESGFGGMEENEEKLKQIKQIKAEAEVLTGGTGNEKAMREAVERRKNKEREVVFGVATELAKKKVEIKEGK